METEQEKLQRLQLRELENKAYLRKVFFVVLGVLACVLVIGKLMGVDF